MDETIDMVSNVEDDYSDQLPDGVIMTLLIPMICPNCSKIHSIPLHANVVHKNGIERMIRMVQEQLVSKGWRVPTAEDFKAHFEALAAAEKERVEMEKAVEKGRPGAFVIPGVKGEA